jgi:DNA-directed RNA polymerase subunit RPC12/RpoP
MLFTCLRCGETREEDIPPHEHDWVAQETVEPTCTEKGYTVYECKNCGVTENRDYIDALGHAWVETDTVVAPSCDAQGYTVFKCSRCDELKHDNFVPALEHVEGDGVVTLPATCEHEGEMTYSCKLCGRELRVEVIPKIDHVYGEAYTDPVCGVDGFWTFTCAVCGDTYDEVDEGSALEHIYDAGVITRIATCTEDGEKTYTCTVCDATKSEVISALGHDLSSETIYATCETDGSITVTCSLCDYTDVTVIPALGHEFTDLIDHLDAACETAGYDVFKCSRCDKTDTVTLPPLDHDWHVKEVIEPTCTAQGYTVYECSRCDATKEADYTPEREHEWGEGVVTRPPTIEAEGIMTYTCKLCGEPRDEVIPKLPIGDTIVVNGVEIAVEVTGGVAVLRPTQEQMAAILATSGKEVIFDLRGQSSVALYISTTWLDKNTDKTITIKTDNGDTSVNTKTLWNNSGKTRLITVNNGRLELKNI